MIEIEPVPQPNGVIPPRIKVIIVQRESLHRSMKVTEYLNRQEMEQLIRRMEKALEYAEEY